jgi:hypothetical protein
MRLELKRVLILPKTWSLLGSFAALAITGTTVFKHLSLMVFEKGHVLALCSLHKGIDIDALQQLLDVPASLLSFTCSTTSVPELAMITS